MSINQIDLNQIINSVENQICIWDPCPQCLLHGPTVLSQCRQQESKLRDPMGRYLGSEEEESSETNNKFKKYFVESEQCGNWRVYKRDESWVIGNEQQRNKIKQEALRTMPRYQSNESRFRFAIILAGPPGSGKSALKKDIITRLPNSLNLANRINRIVNRKQYINLDIDDIVKNNPRFYNEYMAITPPPIPENHEIDVTDPTWVSYINETNNLYSNIRNGTWSKTQMMDFALNHTNTILQNIEDAEEKNQMNINEIIKSNDYEYLKNLINNETKLIIQNNDDSYQIPDYLFLCIRACMCIMKGFNITYETTFKTTESVEFLFKATKQFTNDCEKFNYIFILGLPLVPFPVLKKRIINRFIQNKEKGRKGIGLPNFNNCSIQKALHNSYLNIVSLIDNCTQKEDGEWPCKDIGIDLFVLYDNSTNENKIARYFDAIPITKRSHVLSMRGDESKQATELQIKSRRKFVALLMKNLSCLESNAICLESTESKQCASSKCLNTNTLCVTCENNPCSNNSKMINDIQTFSSPVPYQPIDAETQKENNISKKKIWESQKPINKQRRKTQYKRFLDMYNQRKRNGGSRTRKNRH